MIRSPHLFLVVFTLSFIVACSDDSQSTNGKRAPKPHLVNVATVEKTVVALERERTGTLKADREIVIQNQEEGSIVQHPFYEGDKVKQGEVVVKLDDRLLRAQLARTQALREKAIKDVKRLKRLANKQLMAEVELANAETDLAVAVADEQALNTRVEYATMRSPIDGVVSVRHGELGFIAERYTHLLTIADHSTLITELAVSELLLNSLSVGDTVSITIDALGNRVSQPLSATISRIYPHINSSTRTGTVEISLNPVPEGARPGQLARVSLRTQEAERLLIPFIALRRSSEGDYVYVIEAGKGKKEGEKQITTAQQRFITTGLRINDDIEIVAGLSENENVVTRGFTNLQDGKKVTIIVPRATIENTSPSSSSANP